MRHALVFGSAVLLDVVWALYIAAVAGDHAFMAAVLSILTVTLGGFNIRAIVEDRRYLVSAGLGAFVGTYLTVRL